MPPAKKRMRNEMVPQRGNPAAASVDNGAVSTSHRTVASLLWLLIVLIAIAAIIGVVAKDQIFTLMQKPATNQSLETMNTIATTLYDTGHLKETLSAVAPYLDQSVDPEARARAARVAASSYLDMGGDENSALAFAILKAVANDPAVSNKQRARIMNSIIGPYYVDRAQRTFDLVFDGPPFEGLEKGVDQATALRKAAELSRSYYPTPQAAIFIANYFSGKLLDDPSLSAAQQDEYRKAVALLLQEAQERIPYEQPFGSKRFELVLYHWMAFHSGVLALGDPTYRAEFERSFDDVIAQIKNPANGIVVGQILPYTLLYYAAFLDALDGAAAQDRITPMLEELVSIIETSDPILTTEFTMFMDVERDRPEASRDHNYRFFVSLADGYPEFKAFLIKHGWNL